MRTTILGWVLCGVCVPGLAAWGQQAGAPGCGPEHEKFAVTTGGSKPGAQAATGKAVLYFVEDDTEYASVPRPTTRIGIDGAWIGATHGNSWLFLTVDPGEHHLCSSWQTAVAVGQGHPTSAAHFTAAPGGVYYFVVKNRWWRDIPRVETTLQPLDSDEGQLLVAKYEYSLSKPKR